HRCACGGAAGDSVVPRASHRSREDERRGWAEDARLSALLKGAALESYATISKGVDEKSGAQLRLKPRALRRHDLTGVGDVHELLHGGRVHRKGDRRFSAVHELGEFAGAADA